MYLPLSWSLALLSLVAPGVHAALPVVAPAVHQVFESSNFKDTKLRYVSDSEICETTPGVHQVSGYVDIGKNMSIVCVTCNIP